MKKSLKTAYWVFGFTLVTSPIVQGLATHEDDVADSDSAIAKWLRDNGFVKD